MPPELHQTWRPPVAVPHCVDVSELVHVAPSPPQVEPLQATARPPDVAHWLVPVPVQVAPSAPGAHVPLVQVPLRQCALVLQTAPASARHVPDVQTPETQVVAWFPAVQVPPPPPHVAFEHVPAPAAHNPQVAPKPPHRKGEIVAQNAVFVAQGTLPAGQLFPSAVPLDALAAGAITVCSTGTDQATPPTMPAFFRKSRREAGEAGRVGATAS